MKSCITLNEFTLAYKKLKNKASINTGLIVLATVATAICVLGFKMDSASIIIGSMLVSPLLYPILLLSPSLIKRDIKIFIRLLLALAVLFTFLIGISTLISYFLSIDLSKTEIIERLEDDLFLYLFVAFFSGIAATFAFYWPGVTESIPGTAISVALLPPLSIIGISLSRLDWQIFTTSSLIFLLNIAGIIAGSILSLFLLKFTVCKKK